MAFLAVALGVASAFVVVVRERHHAEPRAVVADPRAASTTTPAATSTPAATATTVAQDEVGPGCSLGETRVLVRSVRVASGVEVARHGGRVAVAVATSPREARAVEVDPWSLQLRTSARWTTTREVRRALPSFPPDDVLDVTADDGADARRGAAIDGDTYAIVFRRAGVVWVETIRHGAVVDGPVALSEQGHRVGAPSVTVMHSGDVVAAWAERAPGTEWTVRWTRWAPGTPPQSPRTLNAPNAIAPSVSEVPGGDGLVLAWTQGTGRTHEVRAAFLDQHGDPRSEPVLVSPPGSNAGQEQLMLEPDGHGVVFFLASQPDGRFALVARALSCTAH
jgi:hypothetical protein